MSKTILSIALALVLLPVATAASPALAQEPVEEGQAEGNQAEEGTLEEGQPLQEPQGGGQPDEDDAEEDGNGQAGNGGEKPGQDGAGAEAGGANENGTVLFHWREAEGGPDWGTGWLYAALGAVGALITMFSLIGGAVPGIAGQARIDADGKRLELLYERLLALAKETPPDAKGIEAIGESVDRLRDDLRRERWRQFTVALLFYVVLGAFFASALAYDLLQAIVIGAGWTGYTGVLGLKKDFGERKKAKDEQLGAAEEALSSVGDGGHEAVGSERGGPLEARNLGRLRDEIRVAKAL